MPHLHLFSLARSANLLERLFCRCFFFIFYFLVVDIMSNEFLGSLLTFQGLVELCNGLIDFAFIWRSLKGRCHGNQLSRINGHFRKKNSLSRYHSEMDKNIRTPMGSLEAH